MGNTRADDPGCLAGVGLAMRSAGRGCGAAASRFIRLLGNPLVQHTGLLSRPGERGVNRHDIEAVC
jgi:hypothetical protein